MRLRLALLLSIVVFVCIVPPSAFAEDAVRIDPELAQGIKDFKEENYEEAVEGLTRAREKDPDSALAAYFLGLAYKQVMDFEKAVSNLKDAGTLKPGVKEALFELAEVYYHLGRNEDCLSQLEVAEKQGAKPAQAAFLKGLVFAKLGRTPEAIDAFRKAKGTDPSMAQAANYQIGVALIKMGKLEEADRELREVIIKDPNSNLAIFARQYVEALERRARERRPFSLAVNVGLEYDDNVILKPADQQAAGDITGEHDARQVATLRAEYAPKSGGPFNYKAQYSLYYSDHDDLDTHNVGSHTFALVPSYTSEKSMVNMLLSYNHTWVAYDEYLKTMTVSPMWFFMPWEGHILQAGVRFQMKDFIQSALMPDEDRDSQEYAASVGWSYLFAENRGVFNLGYEINREETDGINWTYTGHRGTAAVSYPLSSELNISASAGLYYQRYDDTNTNFLKKRRDMNWMGAVLLAYALTPNTSLQFKYNYVRVDSDVAVYDYDKKVFGMGIEVTY